MKRSLVNVSDSELIRLLGDNQDPVMRLVLDRLEDLVDDKEIESLRDTLDRLKDCNTDIEDSRMLACQYLSQLVHIIEHHVKRLELKEQERELIEQVNTYLTENPGCL